MEAQSVQLYRLLAKLQLSSKILNSRDLKGKDYKPADLNFAYLKWHRDVWLMTFIRNWVLLFAQLPRLPSAALEYSQ